MREGSKPPPIPPDASSGRLRAARAGTETQLQYPIEPAPLATPRRMPEPLARALANLQVEDATRAPDDATWRAMLAWIGRQLEQHERDRATYSSGNDLDAELTRLITSERLQRDHLRDQIDLASEVQRSFVPAVPLLTRRYVRLTGVYHPAAACGGDWWNYYDLPNDRVLVVIGDVTGHGLAPALMTGVARGACDALIRHLPDERLDCSVVLRELNHVMCTTGTSQMHMTCSVSILDVPNRSIHVASAGQTRPFLVKPHYAGAQIRPIVATGAPLGSNPDAQYRQITEDVGPDDIVFWFTDGVVDCENAMGEKFGDRRLRNILRDTQWTDPVNLREAVWEQIIDFLGETIPVDDITFAIARCAEPRRRSHRRR